MGTKMGMDMGKFQCLNCGVDCKVILEPNYDTEAIKKGEILTETPKEIVFCPFCGVKYESRN